MAITVDKTISEIVENGLCTGCGTCVGICPMDAIEMVIEHKKGIYIPQLDEEKCNQCGLCFEVCPGHAVDFKQLNLEIFGKEPDDILLGNYLNCYIGHAANHDIRYNSASGGLVTALLIFALERGIINGALVTKTSEGKLFEPQPFIAGTKEEIVSASKSRYCPVPANTALKEILDQDGKFAVVGLPCHLHGIRKAEAMNNKLKQRIVLHFGLLCSETHTFPALEYILCQVGINPQDVIRFDHRGEGRWGQFAATLRDGQRRPLSYREHWTKLLRSFFIPVRCTLCSDHSSELADVSFGDIDLPEFQYDSIGVSTVICRSKIGEHLVKEAASSGVVEVRKADRDRLVHSKAAAFYRKKRDLKVRLSLFRLLGKAVPVDTTNLVKPNFLSYVYVLFLYAEICISRNRWLWRLIKPISTVLGLGERFLGKRE